MCLAWGSPMRYGGSVGLALGWPKLGSQIACGSCSAHGCASFGALLWVAAVVLDWSLVAQNSPLPHPALRPFPHEPSGVLSWGSPQWGGLIQGTFLTRNHAKNGVKHIVVPCRFLVDLVLGWNVAESTVRLSVDVTCVSRRTHACAVRFTPHGRSPCFLACMSGLSCAVHMPEIVRCTLHRNSWY